MFTHIFPHILKTNSFPTYNPSNHPLRATVSLSLNYKNITDFLLKKKKSCLSLKMKTERKSFREELIRKQDTSTLDYLNYKVI